MGVEAVRAPWPLRSRRGRSGVDYRPDPERWDESFMKRR